MCDSSADALPRLVVVEDNPADVRLTKEGVAAAGVELDLQVLNSGQEAIDYFAAVADDDPRNHPNLILLDLNLPGKSGFEVLATVRAEPVFRETPAVVISSSETRDDIARAYDLSANAYVTKPADPDDYIAMIDATVDFWITTTTQPNQ